MTLKRVSYLFGLMLSLGLVWAKEYFPRGCQPQSLDKVKMSLTAQQEKLYFVHNLSDKQIWMANPRMSRLTRGLKPGTWSVLYNPQVSDWRCIQSEQGHEQHVPCQTVLAVCQWSASNADDRSNKNPIWLIEDQTIVYAKAYLQRMGWLFDQKRSKLEKTQA